MKKKIFTFLLFIKIKFEVSSPYGHSSHDFKTAELITKSEIQILVVVVLEFQPLQCRGLVLRASGRDL